jgi:lysozyme
MDKHTRAWLLGATVLMIYDYMQRSPLDGASQGLFLDIWTRLQGVVNTGANMLMSQNGINQIMQREGNKDTIYADSVGNLTGGIGHLLTPLDRLRFNKGDTIAPTQITSWFNNDIGHAENLVNNYVTGSLNQNQFDALVSMAFNLGGQLFRNPDGTETMILTALNNNDMVSASAHIMDWIYPAEIVGRRQSEQAQFNS